MGTIHSFWNILVIATVNNYRSQRKVRLKFNWRDKGVNFFMVKSIFGFLKEVVTPYSICLTMVSKLYQEAGILSQIIENQAQLV